MNEMNLFLKTINWETFFLDAFLSILISLSHDLSDSERNEENSFTNERQNEAIMMDIRLAGRKGVKFNLGNSQGSKHLAMKDENLFYCTTQKCLLSSSRLSEWERNSLRILSAS